MRIVPVLDIKQGQAVHAIAGDRAHYRPVRGAVHPGSDPVALALAFRDNHGFDELYVADLDAIGGSAPQTALHRALLDLGLTLWLDAGLRDVGSLRPFGPDVLARTNLVLALETLAGPSALAALAAQAPPAAARALAFSLDLRDGRPLRPSPNPWPTDDPLAIAEIAIAGGITRLILLDLARVGTGRGTGTEALLSALRARHPTIEIIVGGGIAGPEDLAELDRLGASAALVGSALHLGRLPIATSKEAATGPDRTGGFRAGPCGPVPGP